MPDSAIAPEYAGLARAFLQRIQAAVVAARVVETGVVEYCAALIDRKTRHRRTYRPENLAEIEKRWRQLPLESLILPLELKRGLNTVTLRATRLGVITAAKPGWAPSYAEPNLMIERYEFDIS